ncbi:phosphonate metabolism transcriptional regulator PhnF [Rhodobacterales bacterium HKCCE2091]|nr:phosphonate metabolism transcriptional regulator PhnF [Rhodobacterales bacterium HKCCE2091]
MTSGSTRGPVWQGIAGTLAGEIASGLYAPGQKLPTEAALAGRFGVNRHTVRRALADLAARGVVWSRRGAGVFVATPQPADYAITGRVRFHQQIAAAGRLPSKRILSQETRLAAAGERAALGLEEGGEVHVCDGLSFADAVPIAVFRSVFPAARFPDLPGHLARTGSVTAALSACGLSDYARATTRLTARTADATEARHLRLPEAAPVLVTEAINRDGDGAAVEFGHTVFAGDRVTLTVGD